MDCARIPINIHYDALAKQNKTKWPYEIRIVVRSEENS